MKRFYKSVTVAERDSTFDIRLDGKPVKTPSRKTFSLPIRALAEAIAEEWRAQENEIAPLSMPLTRLANTAIDRGESHRDQMTEDILKFGGGDLLCYRATETDLAERQRSLWDPILDWLADRHRARLKVTTGMTHIAQPAESLLALGQAIRARSPFVLTALHAATTITGSLALALALMDGRLDAAEAFALAHLDETFQAGKWGADVENEKRAKTQARELEMAARFAELSRT